MKQEERRRGGEEERRRGGDEEMRIGGGERGEELPRGENNLQRVLCYIM